MSNDKCAKEKHHFARNSIVTFAGRVEYARTLRGIERGELCRIANLSHSTIYKIEIEHRQGANVTTKVADKIARALNVSRLWLCWGDGDPTLPDSRFTDLHTPEMIEHAKNK